MVPSSEVKPILASMYKCRREMVPCFIGAPGIGKTQGLYEFAEELGVKVVTFILSNTVPSEVSGIRMPDNETKKMEVFDDLRMSSLEDGDILFFDEILEAPPMLWSACLTLIQDRLMASGKKLPDVFIVAASNKVAAPAIIPASVRNRFQFIELGFDFDSWALWFWDKYHVNPEPFRDKIQQDSSSYNILTPREVTKLYLWISSLDSKEKSQALDVVGDMFDNGVVEALEQMVDPVLTAKEQIKIVLDNINVDMPGLEYMSYKTILEKLSSLPEWPKIQSELAAVEFKEEE